MKNGENSIERLSATYASQNLRKITPRSEITATTLDRIEDLLIETVIL